VRADDAIAAVSAQEISAGLGEVLLPAELVYHPFFENPGVKLYGTSTNGLASGNTLQEATVHAVAEVIERDVRSFELLDDRSQRVLTHDAPAHVQQLIAQVERAGLECHLRYSANPYGLPYCSACILEPDEHAPLPVAMGFGLHPNRDIAAVRALTEAVQGRLTTIHGGRDDLMKRHRLNDAIGPAEAGRRIRVLRQLARRTQDSLCFTELPHAEVASIAQAQDCLFERLRSAGLRHVARVTLTPPDYPFQVVRVVVPGAELYEHELKRLGPRLLRHVNGLVANG
jgi:ribosomal protein S12 methylthiotransferase accessory factor